MSIHPTAVVDPEAEIGPDVVIGPYCVIGREVTIGAGCWLQNQVTICGPVKIGARNRFHSFCSIGQQTQDLKYAGEPTYLEIGDGNCFREFVTVNRATAIGSVTRVGNRRNFLAYSHIAHDCVVEDDVIFSNNGTLAGHVLVQAHAIIGGLTAIHQYCRIGRHAITGGCSKIVQDVPPFHDCGWKSGGGSRGQRGWTGTTRRSGRNDPGAEGIVSDLVPRQTEYQTGRGRIGEELWGCDRGEGIDRVY